MGSCFSRRRRVDPPATVRRYPHPDEEEETVKEVLSETPAIRYLDPTTPDKPEDAPAGLLIDERSEISSSEICSLISENLSVSTTTTATNRATEMKEQGDARGCPRDNVATRRNDAPPSPSPVKNRRKRSVSGELLQVTKRDTSVGIGCRSGRTSPSPAKAAVGRTYSAREVRSSKGRALQPAGERSGRRSVSPLVKHAAAMAPDQKRSLSAPRMNGRASPPRRVRQPPPAEKRGGRGPVMDMGGGIGGAEEEAAGGGGDEGKESLENPLVSLECFIFL